MELKIILLFSVALLSALLVSALDDCGLPTQTLTAPNGIIKSHAGIDFGHNYGKNMRCTWHIRAPAGSFVELTAESFEVGGTSTATSCYYDYLSLYDGPFTNGSMLGQFCGSDFVPISSTGRDLTLYFVTNSGSQYNGFKLYYNFTQTPIYSCRSGYFLCGVNHRCVQNSWRCDGDDDCGDDTDERNCPPFSCSSSYFPCVKERRCITTSNLCDGDNDCQDGSDEIPATCKRGAWKCGPLNYTGSTGTVTSPGYPSTYPTDMSCSYEITVPPATQSVRFTFSSTFNIETNVNCAYDYVKVYRLDKSSRAVLDSHGPFCGRTPPAAFSIPFGNQTNSVMVVQFNSDNSDTYAGFQVTWKTS